jgi:hypothetical protein
MSLETRGGGDFVTPGGGRNRSLRARGSGSGGDASGISPFTGKSPGAPVANARTGVSMKAMMEQLKDEGVPQDHRRAAAAMLVGQAQSESQLIPTAQHDPHNGVFTGYGIYGAGDPWNGRGVKRRARMLQWLKDHGYASDSLEGQSKEMAHSAMHDFPAVKQMLLNATPGNMLPNTYNMTKTFESPTFTNDRRGAVQGAYDKGPASSDKSATGPQSMNNMSHFQQDKKLALRIDNHAGANYVVSSGMLGSGSGNFG